jgi:VCBS repeat-containing protein
VVEDGQYQIRLNDSDNRELGRLLVVVDNNRSPLTDAIGTKYLANKNITCGFENDYDDVWQWLPDESAILYFVSYYANRSEYPTGFYTITPDGAEILRIVPPEWSYDRDPAYYYKFGANDSLQEIQLSPDGKKIVFVLRKYDQYSLRQIEVQLWVVETDGTNLTLLDSYDTTFTNASLGDLTWSLNSEYVAYKVFSQSSHVLSIVKIDDADRITAPSSGWEGISWSSDSRKVASISAICGPNGACNEFELWITDLIGNSWKIYSSNNLIWPYGQEWLNESRLIMVEQNYSQETDTLWLIDTSEEADHKQISDSYYEVAVSPDKKGFALIEDNENGSAVTFVTGIGQTYLLSQNPFQNTYSRHLRQLEWSHDGSKLAFFEAEASGSDALRIVDVQGKDSFKSLASENAIFYHLLQWFPDNRFLIARDSDGDYVTDLEDGEKRYLPFRVVRSEGISPFGRYLTYSQAAEELSPCNNGYGDDLWAVSSLLNLSADLRVTKEKTAVNLSGTAADLYFEGYRLAYAETTDPGNWTLIKPPSDAPAFDELFTHWVPPHEGTFHVRLTVWDKAGNTRTVTRRVSWGRSSSVTNLYTSDGLFSPNNDGVKDSTHLYYRVIAPVQLDFHVFNVNGDLIRTLHKEHAVPTEDSIAWDGRDELGSVVPDGTYLIRVFGYEFSVQVDNTVPDVYAAMSPVQQDPDSYETYAELSGRALDDNLKNWVVEYGIGVNPQEWYAYRKGEDSLVKRNDIGNPFLDPIENAIIERSEWGQIGLLGDKRFRVTAEDFAGNKATYLSNVVEERLVFYLWDESKFVRLEGGGITEYLPAMHQISLLETVQEQIASITVQYEQAGQWHDAYSLNAAVDGLADIAWDTSQIDLRNGDSFRLKATDLGGQTHYSNQAMITAAPDDNDDDTPAIVRFSLSVDYSASDVCESISSEATLSVSTPTWTGNVSPKTLTYFIQDTSEFRILEQFNLTTQGLGSVTVPTSELPEASYPVKAVLGYIDLNDHTLEQATAEGTLVVDRALPTAQITYPASSSLICPMQLGEEPSQSYGVAVEGVATDNGFVTGYELSYGVGVDPGTWVVFDRGDRTTEGQLGVWEVAALKGTDYSLRLKAVDATGNVSCSTTNFSIDTLTHINNLFMDKTLFSPNADGQFDEATVSYEMNEYATVDVQVFELLDQANGSPVLGATPLGTIVSAAQHPGGTGSAAWDGKNDSDSIVPDGTYGVAVSATDACGNTSREWVAVELDNTPPVAVIAYPQASDPLGNIVEVLGTLADANFQSYVLEAGEGSSPGLWSTVSSTTGIATESVLGTWNTFGLNGIWTLRLSAADAVGNETETLTTVDVAARQDLIKSLALAPNLFSPNGDTKRDNTTITYELGDICDLTIEIVDSNDSVRKTESVTAASAGVHTLAWDGKDAAGTVVPEGSYTVRFTVVLSSNAAVTQTEKITANVDTSLPLIDISEPSENAYLFSDVTVFGTVSDSHLSEYNVSWTGASASDVLHQGIQSRTGYTFGTLRDFAEGDYTLSVTAQDLAENSTSTSIPFTIDRTPPRAVLDAPANGAYYGSGKDTINISGTIEETNLETYRLRYCSGESPTEWVDLITGDTVPVDPQLFTWTVGNDDGIPDGLYTLSLYARDKAGFEAETSVQATIDNTSPDASLSAPSDGGYVKEATAVTGTAFDVNLDTFQIEMSAGNCSNAFKWAAIETSGTAVQNGLLTTWRALPPDGEHCLRLTATDKLENNAEAMINVKVDTERPASPVLSGEIEDKTDARLTWTENTEPDLAGYNLYRDNQKLNATLLSDIALLEAGLEEGVYTYAVKAVDLAGWESHPSNEVRLAVDQTGPNVRISSPQDDARVSGTLDIRGTAFSADDFKEYRVYMGQGPDPALWTHLRTSPVPVSYDLLTQWETIGAADGEVYLVKLEAEDISGNVNSDQITVTMDNAPPAPPIMVSAVANSPDVTITWQANTEQDLAGYLLYRNGQLVNVDGVVIGELKPYLLAGTTYLDASLPDGIFIYSLLAMDEAGNVSGPSNSIEVAIDAHVPQAVIVEPQDNDHFEHTIAVKAESQDLDVASVQFEYKGARETLWTQLDGPVTTVPRMTHLDPATLGLVYGDYHLRAVATDNGGNTDPAPSSIMLTYTDLTPPAAPVELTAFTNGGDITLSWTANNETDLDGYHIYRTVGGVRTRINAAIVHDPTYLDQGVADGAYSYEVAAADIYGNESGLSNNVPVHIYAPVIEQPYSPTGEPAVQLRGSNAEPDSTVEISIDSGSGPESQGMIPADGEGNFVFDALLVLGETRFEVQATDSAGNVSRMSDVVVVVYNEPPAAPTGLVASVAGDDVTLSWNPNSEPDLRGYCLYRDGARLNDSAAVGLGDVSAMSASSTYSSYYAGQKAFDGNSYTYWRSGYSYGSTDAFWLEIELSSSEFISRVEIDWTNVSYAGKDYEIQIASGQEWIPVAEITDNDSLTNVVDFEVPLTTNRIRILINSSVAAGYYAYVMISEIRITKDQLITENLWQDLDLSDGVYYYNVTTVDEYGFESLPSETVQTGVGDVTPPAAPLNLAASAVGSNMSLTWTGHAEPDLAGYKVFKKVDGEWIEIAALSEMETSYLDSNLVNGVYSYCVTAFDLIGNESAPSNEASGTIGIDLLETPSGLNITPMPEGKVLRADWTDATGQAAGYFLYRSLTSDGPYAKVVGDLLADRTYLDSGLSNGIPYYYVVTAVDAVGNESAYSVEATGIPVDTEAPSKPKVSSGLPSGECVVQYGNSIVLSGTAEAGNILRLYKEGMFYDETTARNGVEVRNTEFENYVGRISMSGDGQTLAYVQNGSIWLSDINLVNKLELIVNGDEPVFSADSSRVAYTFVDAANKKRLGVYDMKTEENVPLTDDANNIIIGSNSYASWSSDGQKISFFGFLNGSYSVWVYDLHSGAMTRLPGTQSAHKPQLSPDGTKVSFRAYPYLHVVDLVTNETIEVDDANYTAVYGWSRDSDRLAFVSYRLGHPDIFVWDSETHSVTQLTDSDEKEAALVWSPDNAELVFERVETGGTRNIWSKSTENEAEQQLILDGIAYLNYLFWADAGQLSYLSGKVLTIIHLAGSFDINDVVLESGENRFHVVAIDPSGNASQPFEEICITFDNSLVPDVGTTVRDVFVYPPFPITGELVAVDVAVWNGGQTEAENLVIDIYLWDPAGNVELVKSEQISYLAAGSGEYVGFTWDSTGRAGLNNIFVIVDALDTVAEKDEANNLVYKDIYVSDIEGVTLSTSLDAGQYQSDQDVHITIELNNSGLERDVGLEAWIEDENGYIVAALESINTMLYYGASETFSFVWNTGVTYAGAYQLHTILHDPPHVIEDQLRSFEILPTIALRSHVTSEKEAYGPHEEVKLRLSTVNDGENYMVPSLTTRVSVADSDDNVVFTAQKDISSLQPNIHALWSTEWNTALHLPGTYEVALTVLLEGVVVSDSAASFVIEGVAVPFGDLAPAPASPVHGAPLHVAYSVRNVGNNGVDPLPLDVVIMDAETRSPVGRYSEIIALAAGGAYAGEVVFATDDYGLKTYLAELQVLIDGSIKALATRSFFVRDGAAPVLEIVLPLSGGIYRGEVGLSVEAADDLSGVDRVEYSVDSGEWSLLPIADYTAGRYASTWVPSASDDGKHDISYRAMDKAGNLSGAVGNQITVITNSPPLTVVDAFEVDEDHLLQVTVPGLLSNDTDPDADPLTVHLSTAVNHGALTLNLDGSFTYTPNENWHGTDRFTYRAHDGEAWSEEATVVITINSVNDAPVARDNSYTTDEDLPLDVALPTVLDDDADVEGDGLTARLIGDVTHGTLIFDADGSFFYTPHDNWYGTDSFTYVANDGASDSNAGTVRIAVDAVNDAPVAVNDEGFAVDEDHTLTLPAATLLANDSDIEGDALTVLLDSNATHGTVGLNEDGSLSYTPELDWNAADSFSYKASDGDADSDPATVTITVHPVNDAPVAQVAAYSTDEDTTLHVSVPGLLEYASDLEVDPLTIALADAPAHGAVTLNGDGSFSYVPNPDWNGTDTFSFRANDGELDSNTAVVTLAVNPVNDAPWISLALSSQTVQYSDGIETVMISAGDIDSPSLVVTADGLPPDLNIVADECASANGVLTCSWSINGRVLGGAAVHDIVVTVNDGELSTDSQMNLVVEQEIARVDFDTENPVSVRVAQDGGNSGEFHVTALVSEATPDLPDNPAAYPGEIGLSGVSINLVPVGPGGSVPPISCSESVDGTRYEGVKRVTCGFNNVEVNTYTLAVHVNGDYYTGMGEDVVVVNDPSLGKATGGGWFTWPGTENVDTGYPGHKTNFGFTMQYGKNGRRVKGNFLLIRHLPDGSISRVKSNALYGMALGVAEGPDGMFGWASFSGKSTYLEPGWPEPVGNHEFVVYIEDHNEPGSGHDRVWVEVHDKNGAVIPDLSMGREAVENTVELDGGNIVAPH